MRALDSQIHDVPSGEQAQYLTFMQGNEVFAIGILAIREIIAYDEPTSVPMMPSFIRGVINLRGAAVPVVDLAVRFGRPSQPVTKRTCIVILERQLEGKPENVGVIVDAVNAVIDIPASAIEPPPAFGARIRSDFLLGLGKVDGKFVSLLAADRVVAADNALAPQQVAAEHS